MKRRDFLAASATAAVPVLMKGNNVNAESNDREYFEIRTFWAEEEDIKARLIARIDDVLLPHMKSLGFRKVGVFSINEALHDADPKYDLMYNKAVFVITAAPSFANFENLHEKLSGPLPDEKRFQRFKDDALYIGQENALLRAFPNCPSLAVPTLDPDRVLQYRCYFSPSLERNRAKRKMFDIRGELALFRKCGMNPVFFGETLYGTMMPNVSYMLSFKNNEACKAGWDKFRKSEEWSKMKSESEFKDTATQVRNLFLKPSPKSEI